MSLDTTWMPHRSWKFERLGHEPRAEDQRLHKQIAERDHKIAEKDQQLAEKDRRLVELEARIEALERADDDAERPSQRLSPNDVPITVDKDDHQSIEHAQGISNLQEALCRANDTIRDREITIITLQNQLLLQKKVDHETQDVRDLRNRVASMESRLQGEGGPPSRNAT
ncbi:ricin-type beta-trefoil lectin domain protein [Ceratobasidium sp. AG-Ba]|nr:ricin-type beta-trefoil lectin domain protein [Ceratobasidium sp. AG-Ba]